MDKLTVIVDADTPVQRIGFLDLRDWSDYAKAVDVNMRHIVQTASQYAVTAFGLCTPSIDVCLYFTDSSRPRMRNKYDAKEEYKEARGKATKSPVYVSEMIHYLFDNYAHQWNMSVADACVAEADDEVVSKAYACLKEETPYVIVGIDKDLKQAPGLHYNFVKEEGEFISKLEADTFIFYQLLVGDSADSIGGIHGIGPVKASKIMKECKSVGDAYEAINDVYSATYKSNAHDLFVERACKLYMLRYPDDSFEKFLVRECS